MTRYCLVHLLDETTIRCLKRGSEAECDALGEKLSKENPEWNMFLVEEEELEGIIVDSIDLM